MMLELAEKKIRKGRPLGLAYQGSKKKISKKIVEIIKQNFGTEKPVYDIFGGGGAITAECLLNGLEVHYNDLDETATSMFQKVVSEDREYLKTLLVSREEFFKTFFSNPMEAARATFFGKINSWTDEYIKINVYGNLESMSEYDVLEEIDYYLEEIFDNTDTWEDYIDNEEEEEEE